MKLTIDLATFYSMGDERRFFQGLNDNPAISDIKGIGRQLECDLMLRNLNRDSLRDLMALLWRYGISLKPISVLSERKKFEWLNDERGYWHRSMFQK
jgi:hypothetical protein